MATREQNVEVFRDTMDWIDGSPQLQKALHEASSEVYYEYDYPTLDHVEPHDQSVEVMRERSFGAAQRLNTELPHARIAVLNFANAFHAGGGVRWGSGAQEESLCRASTLYPLISTPELRDTFYRHHKQVGRPEATDSLIYTEGVVVCKSDDEVPQRLPEREWVTLDVITCAAPNLHDTSLAAPTLFGYHVRRAIHMLTVAAAKGVDVLVLGAFGCGAFRNDPAVVARAWKVALGEFPPAFDRVAFAVWCPPDNQANYQAFHDEFRSLM